MIVNYCFHVFGATIVDLDAVFVRRSYEGGVFEENA